jgi:hypothetical protein
MSNVLDVLIAAHQQYGDPRYLAAVEKGGDFLILAQMPDPQPAWAQHYNLEMQPVWDREFEPPAVSGRESQYILLTLMRLYEVTGKDKYLKPIPAALAYLRKSQLPDGRLSRFYELQTNRPLFMKRTGKRYDLTYSSDDLPTHYGFIVDSRLDEIADRYARLIKASAAGGPPAPSSGASKNAPDVARVRQVIDALDARGAWVEPGRLRFHKVDPPSGVIDCATFAANVKTLCQFLQQTKTSEPTGAQRRE